METIILCSPRLRVSASRKPNLLEQVGFFARDLLESGWAWNQPVRLLPTCRGW